MDTGARPTGTVIDRDLASFVLRYFDAEKSDVGVLPSPRIDEGERLRSS